MAKTMIASTMTDGQIDGLAGKFRDALRKNRDKISSEIAQQIQGLPNLGMELLAVILGHVEMLSNLIVRRVEKIDRSRDNQAVLDATGRKQYVDPEVVKTLTRGTGDSAEVVFVYVGRYLTDDEAEQELALRGLEAAPADDVAAVNEADPDFADQHPNFTHWKGEDGKWRYIAFCRWHDGRNAYVHRREFDWHAHWWLAGRRKP